MNFVLVPCTHLMTVSALALIFYRHVFIFPLLISLFAFSCPFVCASHHPICSVSLAFVSRIVSMFHYYYIVGLFLYFFLYSSFVWSFVFSSIKYAIEVSEYQMHVNKCVHSRHEPVHMPEEYYYCADIIH